MAKKQPRSKSKSKKIGKLKLTNHQREVIAENIDTEFFKIITDVVIPQREVQLALTLAHAGIDEKDLYFFKGQLAICTWIGPFLRGEADRTDTTEYDNDDTNDVAEDDVL